MVAVTKIQHAIQRYLHMKPNMFSRQNIDQTNDNLIADFIFDT